MSEFDAIRLISLLGFLILAGSALAAYRLNWKRSLVYALIWGAVFAAVTLLFNALG